MINAAKELGRTVGYKPVVEADGSILAENKIVSGRFVKLASVASGNSESTATFDTVVKPILGSEAEADLLGIACDDTEKLPYNGLYEVIDNFCKYGKIAAFVCGGLFTVWNDGRGAVFADDVEGIAAGTPLYISNTGVLTTTAGAAETIGAIVVGSVIKAPVSQDGTLFFKAKGL